MEIEELKQCKEAEEGSDDSCPQPLPELKMIHHNLGL